MTQPITPGWKPYLVFTVLMVFWTCLPAQPRETVLDRVVHIEQEILEVPEVPRHESALDLAVKRIDVGDATLYVEEEGSGVPLVLINGGPGGTHHYFHPWFSRAKDYARVIYYDQRGTGFSDFAPGEDGYSVEQAVADLDGIREALGIEQWVLLGYSYGGFLAQYYATTHPENVAGLVLLGAVTGLWVDTGESRQMDYLSEAEKARIRSVQQGILELGKENDWPRETLIRKILFNNFINGDWKRQHFYKPTTLEVARIARYEWVNDRGFNGTMNRSLDRVNLAGAFQRSPFQTLILEGEWDLTWGIEKPGILAGNHPRARFVKFEQAGHGIYRESPELFFDELETFLTGLKPVSAQALADYQRDLEKWRETWQASPGFKVRNAGPGKAGSVRIAASYTADWLQQIPWFNETLRVGFALYDSGRFGEALAAFEELQQIAAREEDETGLATALLWQGHMLDLLDRRGEALDRYRQVADMNVDGGTSHDQYGMEYAYGAYAAERLQAPFERVENSLP